MNEVLVKLKAHLDLQEWPNIYLFKFVIPNESQQIAEAVALFNETAEISFHNSSNGKYTSVSVKEVMLSSDEIIAIYEKAASIKGIISL